jgi:hypothetical protein
MFHPHVPSKIERRKGMEEGRKEGRKGGRDGRRKETGEIH